MTRLEFLKSGAALAAGSALSGCATAAATSAKDARFLFGACRGPNDVALMKSLGYDFWEWGVGAAFVPQKGDEDWKKAKEQILKAPLPLRSCNGFIPGSFRLTGPNANQEPALAYAETALRRADEVGVKTLVFGSGGARNVPGDYTLDRKQWPDVEKGAAQYADFCRELTRRTRDLKTVSVVIEPLRPNESNIINYVWQGVQICREVDSPRLGQLADLFHMMMGGEDAESIVKAADYLRHCHIASYETRLFPGSDPLTDGRLKPYFAALKKIGYAGGVSCECGFGAKEDLAKNLETALQAMQTLERDC